MRKYSRRVTDPTLPRAAAGREGRSAALPCHHAARAAYRDPCAAPSARQDHRRYFNIPTNRVVEFGMRVLIELASAPGALCQRALGAAARLALQRPGAALGDGLARGAAALAELALACHQRRAWRVRAALRAERERSAALRRRATRCDWRESARCEAERRGSRFSARVDARLRLRET